MILGSGTGLFIRRDIPVSVRAMDAFEIVQLRQERAHRQEAYLEFLRVPALSCGIYELPAGGTDSQSPHTEDEVYMVVRGRARIRVGTEDRAVREGTVVFVPARAGHRFHSIEEDLTVLVIFAPAEGAAAHASSRTSGTGL